LALYVQPQQIYDHNGHVIKHVLGLDDTIVQYNLKLKEMVELRLNFFSMLVSTAPFSFFKVYLIMFPIAKFSCKWEFPVPACVPCAAGNLVCDTNGIGLVSGEAFHVLGANGMLTLAMMGGMVSVGLGFAKTADFIRVRREIRHLYKQLSNTASQLVGKTIEIQDDREGHKMHWRVARVKDFDEETRHYHIEYADMVGADTSKSSGQLEASEVDLLGVDDEDIESTSSSGTNNNNVTEVHSHHMRYIVVSENAIIRNLQRSHGKSVDHTSNWQTVQSKLSAMHRLSLESRTSENENNEGIDDNIIRANKGKSIELVEMTV
jgi:hypothetical protein